MLFRELLETLSKADVRFVVIDGVALVLRGSAPASEVSSASP